MVPDFDHETQNDRWVRCDVCEGTGEIPSPQVFMKAHRDLHQEVADLLDTTPKAAYFIIRQTEKIIHKAWREGITS